MLDVSRTNHCATTPITPFDNAVGGLRDRFDQPFTSTDLTIYFHQDRTPRAATVGGLPMWIVLTPGGAGRPRHCATAAIPPGCVSSHPHGPGDIGAGRVGGGKSARQEHLNQDVNKARGLEGGNLG